MNDISKLLQNNIITIMTSLQSMQRECTDIYNAYWKTDAQPTVNALTSTGTAATVASNLTKGNYVDGISFAENLNKFFSNQAVTQSDYLQSINQIKYGNAELVTQLTEATEQIGTRIKQLCLDALEVYKQSLDIVELYFDNEVGDIIGVLDSQRIVPGSEMTVADLTVAITLFQNFQNMITNQSVSTGDYSATISTWQRLDTLE